jgi:azurin
MAGLHRPRAFFGLPASARRGLRLRATMLAVALALTLASTRAADVAVELTALTGLRFEPARFAVAPGAKIALTFRNPDDMMHNVVFTRPGARAAVAEAALALGEQGPARNFVPADERVIAATPIVNPGGTVRLEFTAPATEGVYPYVCTFPGHGLVMFGAMYVARTPRLPPLAEDPHVPPPVVAAATAAALSRPELVRTFLPDCGPAAIAVGLPGGQAYAFDAGTCRLRYAWRGGFIDNSPQLLGKGDQFALASGRIYYRASDTARLRVGDTARPAAVKWRGTRWVAGQPQLLYTLDGAEVTESPRLSADGKNLEIAYEIAGADGPVTFLADADGGAAATASAGTWSGARLMLTPEQAKKFTLTFTERPGIEPLAYWSMNDLIFAGRKDALPGVVGRAFTPGGNLNRWEVLDTGLTLAVLQHAGTLMAWVRTEPAPTAPRSVKVSPAAPVFSAGEDANAFTLAAPPALGRWQHLAAVLHHGTLTLFVDGVEKSRAPLPTALDPAATIRIGSLAKKEFLSGLIDEVRIWDRALTPAQIAAIHRKEAPR